MDFLLIALLTLLNGVFAMSELALASSRKARLTAMAEAGTATATAGTAHAAPLATVRRVTPRGEVESVGDA